MSSNGSCYTCDVYGTPWFLSHDTIADVLLLHTILHNVNIQLKAHVDWVCCWFWAERNFTHGWMKTSSTTLRLVMLALCHCNKYLRWSTYEGKRFILTHTSARFFQQLMIPIALGLLDDAAHYGTCGRVKPLPSWPGCKRKRDQSPISIFDSMSSVSPLGLLLKQPTHQRG